MPKRLHVPLDGKIRDAWGRENRKLLDRRCSECGTVFRPKGKTSRYCSVPCARKKNGGHNKKPGPIWWKNSKGYIEGRVWINGKRVRVKQHRWVMEQSIGRPLSSHENVHHINGEKTDNRIENLEIMPQGKHSAHHNNKRTYKRGYKLNLSEEEKIKRGNRLRAYKAALTKAKGGQA